jgi:hypothetical protein
MVLFPVDVVYMVIEVKTILNKNTMTEATASDAGLTEPLQIIIVNILQSSKELATASECRCNTAVPEYCGFN